MDPLDINFSQAAAVLGGSDDKAQPRLDSGSLNTPPFRGQADVGVVPYAPKRPRMEGGGKSYPITFPLSYSAKPSDQCISPSGIGQVFALAFLAIGACKRKPKIVSRLGLVYFSFPWRFKLR